MTTNPESALRHIRKKDGTVCLCAGAICIDQQEFAEKSAQVGMMAEIYRIAESVIVWSGEEADDNGLAMGKVAAVLKDNLCVGIMSGLDPEHPTGFPLLSCLFKTSALDVDCRFSGAATMSRLSESEGEEEEEEPGLFSRLARGLLLLVSFHYGYLLDIACPGQGPFTEPFLELNLCSLKEGSELAKRYPQSENTKSFRDDVRPSGTFDATFDMYLVQQIEEHMTSTKGRTFLQTEKGY